MYNFLERRRQFIPAHEGQGSLADESMDKIEFIEAQIRDLQDQLKKLKTERVLSCRHRKIAEAYGSHTYHIVDGYSCEYPIRLCLRCGLAEHGPCFLVLKKRSQDMGRGELLSRIFVWQHEL